MQRYYYKDRAITILDSSEFDGEIIALAQYNDTKQKILISMSKVTTKEV